MTYLGDVAVWVVQCDHHFQLVSYLDAVHIGVLHALAQLPREIEICVQDPPLLARILDHVVPVLLPIYRERPVRYLAFPLVFSYVVPLHCRHHYLVDLHQPAVDIPDLQTFQQGREPRLKRNGASEYDGLGGDHNAVFDLVWPDVFDAHGVQEFQGRGLEGADNPHPLLRMQVVSEFAARNGRLQVVGDAGLGHPLDGFAKVAWQHKLKRPFVIPLLKQGALPRAAAHKRLPSVLEENVGAIDLLI